MVEIDYYAYFIPERKITVCSDKPNFNNNIILNQFENENGISCFINIQKYGIYRINLHLSKIDSKNYRHFRDLINKNKETNDNVLNVYLGKSGLFNNIDCRIFSNKMEHKNQFWLNFSQGEISYIKNNNCDFSSIEKCEFLVVDDGLFMKNFIKLNFYFKNENTQQISLLEKKMANKLSTMGDDCDPPCINGACSDGDCACLLGYMGINCSISMNYNFYHRITIF
jgi:hypothetical protein